MGLSIFLCTALVHAQVSINDLSWGFRQTSNIRVRPGPFLAVDQWEQMPGPKPPAFPIATATLKNDGPMTEGLVLRFAVSAKVANIKDPSKTGDWGTFWASEQHIPILRSAQATRIHIADLRLMTSLREMYRAGFWPTSLKIEVMIQPKLGDLEPHPISEKTVPVVWKAP